MSDKPLRDRVNPNEDPFEGLHSEYCEHIQDREDFCDCQNYHQAFMILQEKYRNDLEES